MTNEPSLTEKNEVLFYSQDWERTKIFTLSILPYFDILITKNFLYLIALPSNLAHNIAGVLAVGGSLITGSVEKKSQNKIRPTWLDSKQQLISREYEKIVFLKIPKENLKNSLLLKKSFRQKLAIFTYNKKITLQGNKEEYDRFKNYVESYVY